MWARACKTGTAETSPRWPTAASLLAPYDDRNRRVRVVEQGDGGAYLAPVARDIINAYFSNASTADTILGENTLLQ